MWDNKRNKQKTLTNKSDCVVQLFHIVMSWISRKQSKTFSWTYGKCCLSLADRRRRSTVRPVSESCLKHSTNRVQGMYSRENQLEKVFDYRSKERNN